MARRITIRFDRCVVVPAKSVSPVQGYPLCSSGKRVIAGTLSDVQTIREMPFVGGNVALDFVNTAEERGHPEAGDALLTPADLRLWGQRYGLLARSPRTGADAPGELERAREARELIYALLFA